MLHVFHAVNPFMVNLRERRPAIFIPILVEHYFSAYISCSAGFVLPVSPCLRVSNENLNLLLLFWQDELTGTLVGQCRQSQTTIQRFIERGTANEQLLFEALSVNDELQRVLSRFEEMAAAAPITVSNQSSGPALIPVGVVDEEEALAGNSESPLVRKSAPAKTSNLRGGEADMADLDELVFGLHQPNHQDSRKKNNDNLIDL